MTRPAIGLMGDAQLTNVLRGAVLLDGAGAVALARRGFGRLIGVEARLLTGKTVSLERGEDGKTVLGALGQDCADLRNRAPSVREVSKLFNRRSGLSAGSDYLAPGSLYFENELGGRTFVFAASVQVPPVRHVNAALFSETRKDWVIAALRRLSAQAFDVCYAGDEPVLCETGRSAQGERIFVFDNLDLDPLDDIPVLLCAGRRCVERLQGDGRWKPVSVAETGNGVFVLKSELPPHQPAVFRLLD